MEDIQTAIMYARNQEISNVYRGTRMDTFVKRMQGFGFLIFFLVLLIAPLFLFSDILPNNIMDEIVSSSLKLDAMVYNGKLHVY